ncbi:helix-turn-helix transcriptional regulator [Microbacterium sp. CIAB417]|uniref:helix-turn-helix domain-containing protein n=1 Tax=Microbacterium sp. CIAB417 TaxID=2860287 RepID=UPI001FACBE19|nr:helix-turn-helix transcriptional regulator [Microbacterium sp. CIAB417]
MGDTGARRAADARPEGGPDAQVVLDAVAELRSQGIVVAPHVLARLQARAGTDRAVLGEIALSLTAAQRHGHRALPVPLPVPQAIASSVERLASGSTERDALVVLALGSTDRLDAYLAVTGLTTEQLSVGVLGECVDVAACRVALREPALGEWLQASATAAESASAHERLSIHHAEAGDEVRAAWHTARGASAKAPGAAAVLLAAARRLSAEGQSLAAFHVAVEAFDHAEGAQAEEARRVAGDAALCAGLVADAVDWLGSLFPAGTAEQRTQALAPLVIAETALRGALPITDPAAHRPDHDEAASWTAWARTAGMAAMLSAERGADAAMRMWLAEARDADVRAGAGGAIRDPAAALCWLLSGDPSDPIPDGTLSFGVAAAVRRALDGEFEDGLGILARHEAGIAEEKDPFLQGFERTPLAGAYRAVVDVLLRFWQGDAAAARARLDDALVRLPIGLPFAGLGVVLARRLDLAILGRIGLATQSATDALPTGIRLDALVDRALQAYLAGSVQEAAAHMRLWHDRGAPAPPLAVPGLEELGDGDSSPAVEPPDQRLASELYRRIRTVAQGAWQHEYPSIAERVRAVRSPFTRARVEALLGTTCVIRGDRVAGRRHLHSAHSLFTDAGADAWRDSVGRRLVRLGEQIEQLAGLETVPIPVVDPLAACRAAWEPLVTERELQVAMLVVEGASNRDIAERLQLSVRTVEVHLGRVFAKLDVRSRAELIVLAHRTGRHL